MPRWRDCFAFKRTTVERFKFMAFGCILYERHKWVPTGKGYYSWTDSNTRQENSPADASYFREEKCCRCGSLRHVAGKGPNIHAEFVSEG